MSAIFWSFSAVYASVQKQTLPVADGWWLSVAFVVVSVALGDATALSTCYSSALAASTGRDGKIFAVCGKIPGAISQTIASHGAAPVVKNALFGCARSRSIRQRYVARAAASGILNAGREASSSSPPANIMNVRRWADGKGVTRMVGARTAGFACAFLFL